MSSEGSGSESDSRFNSLKKALVSRGELSADNVTTHKIFSKDPKAHIPERVWNTLTETERQRQALLYGIFNAEFNYNKSLWALSQVAKDFAKLNNRLEREVFKKPFFLTLFPPCSFSGNKRNVMLTTDEEEALFRDVDGLYALSNSLLAQFVRRKEQSEDGVVYSIVDLLEGSLHSFDVYVAFCRKDRRSLQVSTAGVQC